MTVAAGSSTLDCPIGPGSHLVRGALDLLVLSVLRERSLMAGKIADAIERESAEALNVSPNHLYQALHRLTANGCVSGIVSGKDGECAYRCTLKGKRRWEVEQAAWARLSGAVTQVVSSYHTKEIPRAPQSGGSKRTGSRTEPT